MDQKETQEILNRYLNFLEQDKNNLNLLLSVSDCYRKLGDWPKAQQYIDRAKQINPNACLSQQGLLDLHSGKFTEAKEAFTKILSQEDLPAHRYSLAFCLYLNYEIEEATRILRPVIQNNESFYDAQLLMARLLYNQHQLDEAINILEQFANKYGGTGESKGLLSLLYYDNNDKTQAEKLMQEALLLEPNNYDARLVRLMFRLERGEATVNEIKKLIATNANDCRLWFALGTIYLRAVNFPASQEAFLKAAELQPTFYDNWISLGWCQLFQNDLIAAKRSYQQATVLAEESADGWGGLALVSALNNQLTEADALIAKAKELSSNDCFLADVAHIICLNHSQPEQANKQFNKLFPNAAVQINNAVALALKERDSHTSLH